MKNCFYTILMEKSSLQIVENFSVIPMQYFIKNSNPTKSSGNLRWAFPVRYHSLGKIVSMKNLNFHDDRNTNLQTVAFKRNHNYLTLPQVSNIT